MSASVPSDYVGRFAPSPTGPLHFGSLLAAMASSLQARSKQGRWLVRIEDIDPPREPAGSDKLILDALHAYGFQWDGPVTYQSESTALHLSFIADLLDRGLAYPCKCSRRTLADARKGALGRIYPGTCRDGCDSTDVSVRAITDDQAIGFLDGLQGNVTQHLESESGDFIIRRRDGLVAYHLAVVVDDHLQSITEVVRGIDLMDSTPRQIHLQRQLGFSTPEYLHIPVAINSTGQKLSKLTGAEAIPEENPRPTLIAALAALGQETTPDLELASLDEIWAWAVEHWNTTPLAGMKTVADQQASLAGSENGLR
jgi:glutamyl-Q tRNA(Asp) synthetase